MILNAKQAGELLGVNAWTVRSWAKKGILPTLTTPNGVRQVWRFDYAAVRRFKTNRTIGARIRSVDLDDPVLSPVAKPAALMGMLARLDRVEQKLDRLLALWS